MKDSEYKYRNFNVNNITGKLNEDLSNLENHTFKIQGIKIMEIIIKRRENDWHASIEGNSAIWGRGKSKYEAIGDLITTHAEVFNITVVENEPWILKPQ